MYKSCGVCESCTIVHCLFSLKLHPVVSWLVYVRSFHFRAIFYKFSTRLSSSRLERLLLSSKEDLFCKNSRLNICRDIRTKIQCIELALCTVRKGGSVLRCFYSFERV